MDNQIIKIYVALIFWIIVTFIISKLFLDCQFMRKNSVLHDRYILLGLCLIILGSLSILYIGGLISVLNLPAERNYLHDINDKNYPLSSAQMENAKLNMSDAMQGNLLVQTCLTTIISLVSGGVGGNFIFKGLVEKYETKSRIHKV